MAELNNFSGILQMVSALNLAAIARLKQSWKHVPLKLVGTLETLRDLMSPHSNYDLYRTALTTAAFPVLPYQGVLTKDLTFIEDAHADVLPNGMVLLFIYICVCVCVCFICLFSSLWCGARIHRCFLASPTLRPLFLLSLSLTFVSVSFSALLLCRIDQF
jgi:RasGEF domain